MQRQRFSGPLFIVGLPRSGTKLIRDLLNQHPEIGIPIVESHFIPYMITKFGNPPAFDHSTRFNQFYKALMETPFYWQMQQQGRILKKDDLVQKADLTSWSSIFAAILKFYLPLGKAPEIIWGDKTPGYLRHMALLRSLYPQARFLHIIRDPRDYCLSVKKAWGKSMYRAADTWRKTLETACIEGQFLGKAYMEIHYEALLENPEQVLRSVCQFIDCDFVSEMVRLNRSTEGLGDAKDQTEIVQNNQQKYLTQLSPATIKRIEEIVYPVAKAVDYKPKYSKTFKPVGRIQQKLYHLYDGCAAMKFHVKEKGIRQGVLYFFRLHQRSSWR